MSMINCMWRDVAMVAEKWQLPPQKKLASLSAKIISGVPKTPIHFPNTSYAAFPGVRPFLFSPRRSNRRIHWGMYLVCGETTRPPHRLKIDPNKHIVGFWDMYFSYFPQQSFLRKFTLLSCTHNAIRGRRNFALGPKQLKMRCLRVEHGGFANPA